MSTTYDLGLREQTYSSENGLREYHELSEQSWRLWLIEALDRSAGVDIACQIKGLSGRQHDILTSDVLPSSVSIAVHLKQQ